MRLIFVVAHAGHQHLDPATVLRWWSWEPFVVAAASFAPDGCTAFAVGV